MDCYLAAVVGAAGQAYGLFRGTTSAADCHPPAT